MRHLNKVRKINKPADHRRAMLSNLAVSLFTHGQIKTTITKAKALREYAEHMITLAKRGDLNSRRLVMARLRNNSSAIKNCVNFLFDKIAPVYQDLAGGYTRIMRLGFRKGDCSEICLIQLLNYEGLSYQSYLKKEDKVKKAVPAVSESTPTPAQASQPASKNVRRSKKETPAISSDPTPPTQVPPSPESENPVMEPEATDSSPQSISNQN